MYPGLVAIWKGKRYFWNRLMYVIIHPVGIPYNERFINVLLDLLNITTFHPQPGLHQVNGIVSVGCWILKL